MENDKRYNKQSFDLAFHFSFNQNKLWTSWRSKQGSFIQQTQYFIPVEIDLSVVLARLGIWLFHLSRRTTVIQDLLVRRQFSLVPDNRTNVNVEAWPMVPLISHPSFFFNINFFSCTQHFATFYVSLYTKKTNQTAVSIHTGFLTYA